MKLDSDVKFEEECTCQFKIDMKNLNEFWPEHSNISKIYPLMGCLWPKYIMFELEVIFDGTKDWCNIWRKAELRFQKWHEELGKFSPDNLKVSKLGL